MVITPSVTAKLLSVLPEDAALPYCPKTLPPGLTIHKKNQKQHQRERPPSSHPWPPYLQGLGVLALPLQVLQLLLLQPALQGALLIALALQLLKGGLQVVLLAV